MVVDHVRATKPFAIIKLPVVGFLLRIAQVLAHRPMVVELMAELVADRTMVGIEAVEVGRTGEEIARQIAVLRWQELNWCQPVPLVVGQDGERGLFIRLPLERRRDEDAIVAGIVGFELAVANQTGQPVGPHAGMVDRAANIQPGLDRVEAAIAEEAVIDRLVGRPLSDGIDHAASLVLAVEHRGRSLQHLDPLQPVGLDLETGEVDHFLWQPVAIDRRGAEVETTDQALVEAIVDTPWRSGDAGKIGQGVLKLPRLAVVELLAGHHRNRARNFLQRRVGLRAGGGVPGDVAVIRSDRAVALSLDIDRVELGRGFLRKGLSAKQGRKRCDHEALGPASPTRRTICTQPHLDTPSCLQCAQDRPAPAPISNC